MHSALLVGTTLLAFGPISVDPDDAMRMKDVMDNVLVRLVSARTDNTAAGRLVAKFAGLDGDQAEFEVRFPSSWTTHEATLINVIRSCTEKSGVLGVEASPAKIEAIFSAPPRSPGKPDDFNRWFVSSLGIPDPK